MVVLYSNYLYIKFQAIVDLNRKITLKKNKEIMLIFYLTWSKAFTLKRIS